MPVKKTGEDATSTAKIVAVTSTQELRRTAARMPSGMAMNIERMNENPASFRVSGSRSRMRVVTSVRCR